MPAASNPASFSAGSSPFRSRRARARPALPRSGGEARGLLPELLLEAVGEGCREPDLRVDEEEGAGLGLLPLAEDLPTAHGADPAHLRAAKLVEADQGPLPPEAELAGVRPREDHEAERVRRHAVGPFRNRASRLSKGSGASPSASRRSLSGRLRWGPRGGRGPPSIAGRGRGARGSPGRGSGRSSGRPARAGPCGRRSRGGHRASAPPAGRSGGDALVRGVAGGEALDRQPLEERRELLEPELPRRRDLPTASGHDLAALVEVTDELSHAASVGLELGLEPLGHGSGTVLASVRTRSSRQASRAEGGSMTGRPDRRDPEARRQAGRVIDERGESLLDPPSNGSRGPRGTIPTRKSGSSARRAAVSSPRRSCPISMGPRTGSSPSCACSATGSRPPPGRDPARRPAAGRDP